MRRGEPVWAALRACSCGRLQSRVEGKASRGCSTRSRTAMLDCAHSHLSFLISCRYFGAELSLVHLSRCLPFSMADISESKGRKVISQFCLKLLFGVAGWTCMACMHAWRTFRLFKVKPLTTICLVSGTLFLGSFCSANRRRFSILSTVGGFLTQIALHTHPWVLMLPLTKGFGDNVGCNIVD